MRSRCIFGVDSKTYLNGKIPNNYCHHGHLTKTSWPSNKDIQTLVDAAAGLFAHPTAVLRHVAYPPDPRFRERLQSVLVALPDARKQVSTSPFSQLDALYVHIMEQIPENILLFAQLFLFFGLDDWSTDFRWSVATRCCIFRISECIGEYI